LTITLTPLPPTAAGIPRARREVRGIFHAAGLLGLDHPLYPLLVDGQVDVRCLHLGTGPRDCKQFEVQTRASEQKQTDHDNPNCSEHQHPRCCWKNTLPDSPLESATLTVERLSVTLFLPGGSLPRLAPGLVNEKTDVVEHLRYSTTPAYSSTGPPARPGCPSSSHPTTLSPFFRRGVLGLPRFQGPPLQRRSEHFPGEQGGQDKEDQNSSKPTIHLSS